VESISPRHVGRLLQEATQTTPDPLLVDSPDEEFDAKVSDITQLYMSAIERAKLGERTVCIDEMTGIQALERLAPDLPLRPGKVQRREFEYPSWNTKLDCQFRCCYRSSHLSDLWRYKN